MSQRARHEELGMSRVALPSGLYIRYPYVVYFRDCASDMLYIALLSGSYIRCVVMYISSTEMQDIKGVDQSNQYNLLEPTIQKAEAVRDGTSAELSINQLFHPSTGRSGLSASGLRKGRAAGGRLDKALFCIRIWTMHVLRKEEGQFSRRS